jgi:hypothetical protein
MRSRSAAIRRCRKTIRSASAGGRCGGEIWAAVDFPVGHIGRMNFCINPAEHLKLKKPAESKAA